MKFSCPSCRTHLVDEQAYTGERITCPKCQTEFAAPAPPRPEPVWPNIFMMVYKVIGVIGFAMFLVGVIAQMYEARVTGIIVILASMPAIMLAGIWSRVSIIADELIDANNRVPPNFQTIQHDHAVGPPPPIPQAPYRSQPSSLSD